MTNKFDELTKGLAQSVTRRAALKKFGVGLAGVVLASLGLANKAEARGFTACTGWACRSQDGSTYTQWLCGRNAPSGSGLHCKPIGRADCPTCYLQHGGLQCC